LKVGRNKKAWLFASRNKLWDSQDRERLVNFRGMILDELLSNEDWRRREFPVARDKVFLAHAGDCPLPQRVVDAVTHYAQQCTTGDQEKFVYPGILNEGRKHAASLLNCQAEEVAFVGPTSLALSFIASGLKFRKGENILIYFDDYPSNVYPWMALADKGVEVRMMNTRGLGVIRPVDVIGQVDENTRLVALASCHFISGYRIDYQAIGKALHQRNILFCLDAIQTLGAFPTTVEHVDLLAADAHKWLLGPCGAGLMYVRQSLQERLTPPIYGWNNVRCPNYVAQEQIVFRKSSQKYEAGTHNLLGIVGLVAAMEMILGLGVDNIARELLRKRGLMVPALREKGFTVVQGDESAEAGSGIVSFYKSGADLAALHQALSDANIITSLRADRSGQKYIRLSPHFYNSDAELERTIEMIQRAA
jgi:cysteine desulfurase/selenocysteine lyase